ncbi:LOB domain-containing protein 18 [Ranunculus cassubicifolius]
MSASSSTSGGHGGPSGSGGGPSGGHGGGTGPCGACKFLRRKCVAGCIFAPYFDSEQGATHFAAVHKVFGASNVSKLLLHIPVHKRLDAVVTICYEAQARLRDPVYGCVANIFALQQQVVNLQAELAYMQAHLATMELPIPPPAPPPPMLMTSPLLSIADLPSASSMPANFDLATLFDPMQPSWAFQPRQMDFRQYGSGRIPSENPLSSSGDLQALARELLQRQGTTGGATSTTAPSAPPPPPPPSGCE